MKFKTEILQFGNNTGIFIPEEVLEQLGGGKKPLVKITLNNYTYRSAVGKMEGKFLVSLSAEHRKNAKAKGGDQVEVVLELDNEPRNVELPPDFAQLLNADSVADAAFAKLAPSKQKALVVSINEAKSTETRSKRIEKALLTLRG